MELKIIQRKDLDVTKWDALVANSTGASVFSFAWYLDALAENWCVISDDSYSIGIALPFTVRMTQRILYTPIFVSYLELLGGKEEVHFDKFRSLIVKEFKLIEVEFKQPILGDDNAVFISQLLEEEAKQKPQVNRMLNKSKRFDLTVQQTSNWKPIFEIIKSELKHKFSGMSDVSMARLSEMYEKAERKGLITAFEVTRTDACQGGIICFKDDNHLFYSKGAVLEASRDNGGMYLAIDAAIIHGRKNKLSFDFGGSRVEGVRRFNTNFGGRDFEYFSYRINNGPVWFNWMRSIKNRWFKKS